MPKPVLVIEDDQDHQFLLLRALSKAGVEDVKMVSSLEEGIAACAQRPRAVLVVDSGVVGENKHEAVARFRQVCPSAWIIGYSAGPHKSQWADAHYLKGESIETLIEDIERHAS